MELQSIDPQARTHALLPQRRRRHLGQTFWKASVFPCARASSALALIDSSRRTYSVGKISFFESKELNIESWRLKRPPKPPNVSRTIRVIRRCTSNANGRCVSSDVAVGNFSPPASPSFGSKKGRELPKAVEGYRCFQKLVYLFLSLGGQRRVLKPLLSNAKNLASRKPFRALAPV